MAQLATNCMELKLRKYYKINAPGERENNKECSRERVDEKTVPDEISQRDNKSLNVATSQPANIQILAVELEPDKCLTSLEDESVYNKNRNDGPSEKEAFDATDVAPNGSSYRVEQMEDNHGKYTHFCIVRIPLVELFQLHVILFFSPQHCSESQK